jgi:hypothetical protein
LAIVFDELLNTMQPSTGFEQSTAMAKFRELEAAGFDMEALLQMLVDLQTEMVITISPSPSLTTVLFPFLECSILLPALILFSNSTCLLRM